MIVLADEYNVPIHKDICAMDSQVALVPLYFTYVYHIIPFPTLSLSTFLHDQHDPQLYLPFH